MGICELAVYKVWWKTGNSFLFALNEQAEGRLSYFRMYSLHSPNSLGTGTAKYWTQTQTNTNPNDTEASATEDMCARALRAIKIASRKVLWEQEEQPPSPPLVETVYRPWNKFVTLRESKDRHSDAPVKAPDITLKLEGNTHNYQKIIRVIIRNKASVPLFTGRSEKRRAFRHYLALSIL